MWFIFHKERPGSRIPLLLDVEWVIGRQFCDIVINDDATVSRKHANIKCVQSQQVVGGRPTKLLLTDISKFGTWVNEDKVSGQREVTVGDTIKFGSPKSVYEIAYEPLIVTSSCLDNPSKMAAKSSLQQLGGVMVTEWKQECQLLLMTSLSVTIKVVNALVAQKYVVTPQYLEDFFTAATNKSPLPQPSKYLPPLAESQLNPNEVSFTPNPERTKVFSNLTFYFVNPKQLHKLKYTIELTGGVATLVEREEEGPLVAQNAVVMQCDMNDGTLSESARKLAAFVVEVLKRHEKRAIADSEIGYAVLYCSTQRHCNPDIKPGRYALSHLPSQTFSMQWHSGTQNSQPVLVQDTEVDELRKPAPKRREMVAPNQNQATKAPDMTPSGEVRIKSEPLSLPIANSVAMETHCGSLEIAISQNHDKVLNETTLLKEVKQEIPSQIENIGSEIGNTHANIHVFSEKIIEKVEPGDSLDDARTLASKRQISDDNDVATTQPPKRRRKVNSMYDSDSDDSVKGVAASKSAAKNKRKGAMFDSDSDDGMDIIPVKTTRATRVTNVKAVCKVADDKIADDKIANDIMMESEKEGIETEEDIPAKNVDKIEISLNKNPTKEEKKPENLKKNEIDEDMRRHRAVDPDGFLNARHISKDSVAVCKRYQKEADLPSSTVLSKFVSLVHREVGQSKRVEQTREDGMMMWKGTLVKNFKKFQKSHYQGANKLPQIIGGRDLQPHMNTKNARIDDMFKDHLQAESQHSQESRMADAMFEMSFASSKGKKTRR